MLNSSIVSYHIWLKLSLGGMSTLVINTWLVNKCQSLTADNTCTWAEKQVCRWVTDVPCHWAVPWHAARCLCHQSEWSRNPSPSWHAPPCRVPQTSDAAGPPSRPTWGFSRTTLSPANNTAAVSYCVTLPSPCENPTLTYSESSVNWQTTALIFPFNFVLKL